MITLRARCLSLRSLFYLNLLALLHGEALGDGGTVARVCQIFCVNSFLS